MHRPASAGRTTGFRRKSLQQRLVSRARQSGRPKNGRLSCRTRRERAPKQRVHGQRICEGPSQQACYKLGPSGPWEGFLALETRRNPLMTLYTTGTLKRRISARGPTVVARGPQATLLPRTSFIHTCSCEHSLPAGSVPRCPPTPMLSATERLRRRLRPSELDLFEPAGQDGRTCQYLAVIHHTGWFHHKSSWSSCKFVCV